MPKMRVMQATQPKGPFELVEREILEPGAGAVRITVEACGICYRGSLPKGGFRVFNTRLLAHELRKV
jgi:D-arabinose 1-dehydrogenase-like Zn-dependent alcohol dehydrogenase